jgi:hypothetical protein
MLPLFALEGYGQPDLDQLKRFLRTIRLAEIEGSLRWSLRDIVDFSTKRSAIPEDPDQLFVTAYRVTALPTPRFNFFMTTKRLISIAQKVRFFLIQIVIKKLELIKLYILY